MTTDERIARMQLWLAYSLMSEANAIEYGWNPDTEREVSPYEITEAMIERADELQSRVSPLVESAYRRLGIAGDRDAQGEAWRSAISEFCSVEPD